MHAEFKFLINFFQKWAYDYPFSVYVRPRVICTFGGPSVEDLSFLGRQLGPSSSTPRTQPIGPLSSARCPLPPFSTPRPLVVGPLILSSSATCPRLAPQPRICHFWAGRLAPPPRPLDLSQSAHSTRPVVLGSSSLARRPRSDFPLASSPWPRPLVLVPSS